LVGLVVGLGLRDDFGAGFWVFEAAMLLLIVVGLIAARLTVHVSDLSVSAWFGWGWPRREIEFVEVDNTNVVRNSWWYGWGLRKIHGGWMYNNGGRDAVEMTLRSGKVFRIGTDQPAELLAAIERAQTA